MNGPLYLSRARLRRDAPVAALRELLLPNDRGRRAGAGHKLVWTLFADDPGRERDFLWRETDAGTFYILSRRLPDDGHGLFDIDPPRAFAPSLAPGDRLRFSLRANATVARGGGAGVRGKPCDVVMAAIHAVPRGARAEARAAALSAAGRAWFEAQGRRCGFAIPGGSPEGDEAAQGPAMVRVTNYHTLRVEHAGPAARIGVLDIEGLLEVREPERFVESVAAGFGRAKAFGCGLMLIRRA